VGLGNAFLGSRYCRQAWFHGCFAFLQCIANGAKLACPALPCTTSQPVYFYPLTCLPAFTSHLCFFAVSLLGPPRKGFAHHSHGIASEACSGSLCNYVDIPDFCERIQWPTAVISLGFASKFLVDLLPGPHCTLLFTINEHLANLEYTAPYD